MHCVQSRSRRIRKRRRPVSATEDTNRQARHPPGRPGRPAAAAPQHRRFRIGSEGTGTEDQDRSPTELTSFSDLSWQLPVRQFKDFDSIRAKIVDDLLAYTQSETIWTSAPDLPFNVRPWPNAAGRRPETRAERRSPLSCHSNPRIRKGRFPGCSSFEPASLEPARARCTYAPTHQRSRRVSREIGLVFIMPAGGGAHLAPSANAANRPPRGLPR